jgi:hypothetical protein
MSSKCATLGCIGCLMIFLAACLCSLAITAIIVANRDDDRCIGSYAGIDLSYETWLMVYGIVTLVSVGIAGALGTLALAGAVVGEKITAYLTGCSAIVLFALWLIWQFCWYVVGSILYFQTVYSNCQAGTTIYQFGLALFIIQTTTFACVTFGGSNEVRNR